MKGDAEGRKQGEIKTRVLFFLNAITGYGLHLREERARSQRRVGCFVKALCFKGDCSNDLSWKYRSLLEHLWCQRQSELLEF